MKRILLALGCLGLLAGLAWWSNAQSANEPPRPTWVEVAPGVWQTNTLPYGYALVEGDEALLIDCPVDASGLKAKGIKTIAGVLLTHHHRDSVAALASYREAKVPVRAAKAAAEWLTPEGVRKYWADSLPLRNSRTAYFVLPVGVEGVDCSLEDGQTVQWRGRTIKVVATPGHARDHLAFAVTTATQPTPIVFAGDALFHGGTMWTPFTTDWDHWTDMGLKPSHESLRKLAALKPHAVYLAHGKPLTKEPITALESTAKAVEEVGFLRSFERYSKRLGDVPQYKFLVPKEQVASGGDKPWSKVSEHLFITGNTYVLVSKDEKAYLVLDPWGQRSIDQLTKLKKDQGLGTLEVVMFSHAHYDHYDGIYLLPDREKFRVWTLDRVAEPLAEPFMMRAPFLDSRPVTFDKKYQDGDVGTWREYSFRFHHFPGQTEFTMAVETTIDGKKCLFTADNFFHQEQFSGSGGWMGLNRSFPMPYSRSAQKVLGIAPEWILAEHGGPYEYNEEDYRRRVKWGETSSKAADAICVSGVVEYDWDPNRITTRPVLKKAKPGDAVTTRIQVRNPSKQAAKVHITLEGRGLVPDQSFTLDVGIGKLAEQPLTLRLPATIKPGRHIFMLRNHEAAGVECCDAFFAVDVE